MKNSEAYYAQTVYALKDVPLQGNTILIIDSDNRPMHGDCKAILKRMLEDARFKKWNFFWTVPDSVECTYEDIDDPRIEYLAQGSYGFVKACEEAAVIITSEQLPEYYVKKKGQMVIGCFPVSFFLDGDKITRRRALFQLTLDKTDILCSECGYISKCLDEMYKNAAPCEIFPVVPARYTLPSKTHADILVSLTKTVQGNKFADLERKYKDCNLLCIQHGKTILFRINNILYQSFQNENEPDILEHVVSDQTIFLEVAKKTDVIITNKFLEAYDALQMSKSCIMISESRYLPPYFSDINMDKLYFADDWKMAISLLKELLPEIKCQEFPDSQEKSLSDLLDIVLESGSGKISVNKELTGEELWIVPGNISSGFWQAMQYYKSENDISVLARSSENGILWKKHEELRNDKRFYCKIGMCPVTEEENDKEETLQMEWKRILGDRFFEKAYVWHAKDSLWNELYSCMPASTYIEIDEEKMSSLLYPGLVPIPENKLTSVTINGEEYYELGSNDNIRYYLKTKADINTLDIMFVRKLSDLDGYMNMIKEREDKNLVFIFIDPYGFMSGMEELDYNFIYWIPRNILPVKLLAAAQHVYGYGADVIFGEGLKIIR